MCNKRSKEAHRNGVRLRGHLKMRSTALLALGALRSWYADLFRNVPALDRMNKLVTRRRVLVFLMLLSASNLLFQWAIYPQYYHNTCDMQRSIGLIRNTCADYSSGTVGGSSCRQLCTTGNIDYERCLNYRWGKTVAYMQHQPPGGDVLNRVVLKTDMSYLGAGKPLPEFLLNVTHSQNVNLVKEMGTVLRKLVKRSLDISLNKSDTDFLSDLWGYSFTDYVSGAEDKTLAVNSALKSIWYLAQQPEYLFMRLHEQYGFAPKLLGTCGAMYLVEHTPSIAERKSGLFNGRGASIHLSPWPERARLALKLMTLLKDLEGGLHQPLQLCDVKSANFGVRKGSDEIILIDTDKDKFESVMRRDLEAVNCTTDDHCGTLTCPVTCDTSRNRCIVKRNNNNLQSICERVFLDPVGPIETGLLRGAPAHISSELSALVHECAFPATSRRSRMRSAIFGKITETTEQFINTEYPNDFVRLRLIEMIKKGLNTS